MPFLILQVLLISSTLMHLCESILIQNIHIPVNLYIYDPTLFHMHTRCILHRPCLEVNNVTKHSVDVLFIESLLSLLTNTLEYPNLNESSIHSHANGDRSNRSDPTLYIIPVFASQSVNGRCGNHHRNIQQMYESFSYRERI